jgi:hypothetical protein
MMRDMKDFVATMCDGSTMTLEPIEFLPVEPSNYVWVAGWIACDRDEVLVEGVDQKDYFITEDGNVYLNGDDSEAIGIVPELEAESMRREQELERHTSCGTTVVIRDGIQVCPRCEIENPYTTR